MAQSLSQLSELLHSIYTGPETLKAQFKVRWSCSKHQRPDSDKYKDVCVAAELTGKPCPDIYECTHVESRLVEEGCAECRQSDWVLVDPPELEFKLQHSMASYLETPILMGILTGKVTPHITIDWGEDGTD